MSAIIRWLVPGGAIHDLTTRVDNGADERFSVTTMAEECSVGTSNITVRDEAGTLEIVGLNAFSIHESDSTGPDPYIFFGRFGQREQVRGRYRVGASRDIVCEIQDINTIASNYIVGDTESGDRPEESHATRAAWVAARMPNIDNDDLVIITSSVTMPEYDYTGMSWQQVLDDLCRASGYQSFVWFDGENNQKQLVYADPAGTWLTTDIRLSNDLSEVDEVTTFALSIDATMTIDPSRVASRVFARGDGIDDFYRNATTEILHARRDVAMDWVTVRSASVLAARATRSLQNDLDTEESILKGSVLLPSTLASQFRAGQRFQCHATHLTGLQDDFTWMRLLQTTHTMVVAGLYRIEFEAEFPGEAPDEPVSCGDGEYEATATGTYHPIHSATSTAVVYYLRAGAAEPIVPTPGTIGNPNFPQYGTGTDPDYIGDCAASYVRIMVVGAGELVVRTATYSGSPRAITATLKHFSEGEYTYDDAQSGTTGDTFTFDVSTHDGTECIHMVDVVDTGAVCGGKFGFAGADWTSAE